jgi:GntR family transcriptional regulator
MKVIISNSSPDPIYEQITRQVKSQIISGELAEGQALPSIRRLAHDLQISVITTKRAYDELEKEGFINTVGGKGSFVAVQNPELLREKKMKIVEEKLAQAVDEAKLMGIGEDQIAHMLQLLFQEDE